MNAEQSIAALREEPASSMTKCSVDQRLYFAMVVEKAIADALVRFVEKG